MSLPVSPHPWLVVDLITRAVIGCRLERGATDKLDQVLGAVIDLRRALERGPLFN